MERVNIPISGINTQADEYSPHDGSCLQMDKFRPVGNKDNPKWEVITEPNSLTFDNGSEPSPFTVLGTHYSNGSWYAAVFFAIIGPSSPRIRLYKCTLASNVITFDEELIVYISQNNTSVNISSSSKVFFQDFGEDEFCFMISPGNDETEGQHPIWRIKNDVPTALVIRPEHHLLTVTVNDESETKTNFDNLYEGKTTKDTFTHGISNARNLITGQSAQKTRVLDFGSIKNAQEETVVDSLTYPGILKDKDKYIGIITAFKHPNGQWVKHSQPYVLKIEGQTSGVGTNVEYATLSFSPTSEYVNSSANYNLNLGSDFFNYGHASDNDDWPTLDRVGVFITTPKSTYTKAVEEGTYYKIGEAEVSEDIEWEENEEKIVTGEVLNADPFSHHVISGKKISEYGNNLVLLRSVSNFGLPGGEWHSHQGLSLNGGGVYNLDSVIQPKRASSVTGTVDVGGYTVADNDGCYLRVTIEIGDETFYRWGPINVRYATNGGGTLIGFFSDLISYPDLQATHMDLWWRDSGSGSYGKILDLDLTPHERLNLSYFTFINTTSGGVYDYAFSWAGVTEFLTGSELTDLRNDDNSQMFVEEQEFKVSDLTKTFFPLERSYQVTDTITGLVDNTNEVGEGQFGQYPLYVLGKNKIFGASGSGGVLVNRFDLLSQNHGVRDFDGAVVYKNTLFFVSKTGLHALNGVNIIDIYDRVEGATDNYVITNATTKKPSIDSTINLFEEIINEDNPVMVGVHTPTREVIFSTGPTGGGLLIYNEKYDQWYTYSLYDLDQDGGTSAPSDRGGLSQMISHGGSLSLFISATDPADSFVYEWGVDTAKCDKFAVITNPMVVNNYSIMKRLRQCVLQGTFDINAIGSDGANGLYALNVTLEGKRSTHNDWERIISYTEDTVKSIKSFYLKSNRGSFQAFRLVINGENLAAGSFISNFLCEFTNRGGRFRT